MMSGQISSIWFRVPSDLPVRLKNCIDTACNGLKNEGFVFFRADDVGVPGRQFARLTEIFISKRASLSLAVVPAWLTQPRWRQTQSLCRDASSLFCWHQHGWRHINHERSGKKQEFGPGRSVAQIEGDLLKGRQRLEYLIGDSFTPVYTPPWNRCSQLTLESLRKLGYHAVSRSRGSLPPVPPGLPDFQVNVDLHTRKLENSPGDWTHLLDELRFTISSGCCGIMLHHQRMNDGAFAFLGNLLQIFTNHKNLRIVNFKHLIDSGGHRSH